MFPRTDFEVYSVLPFWGYEKLTLPELTKWIKILCPTSKSKWVTWLSRSQLHTNCTSATNLGHKTHRQLIPTNFTNRSMNFPMLSMWLTSIRMQEFFLHLEHGNSVDPKERRLDCHNGNATKKQPFETSTKTPQKRHVWKMSNEKTPWKQNFGIINKRKHIKNGTSDLNALPATCLRHT